MPHQDRLIATRHQHHPMTLWRIPAIARMLADIHRTVVPLLYIVPSILRLARFIANHQHSLNGILAHMRLRSIPNVMALHNCFYHHPSRQPPVTYQSAPPTRHPLQHLDTLHLSVIHQTVSPLRLHIMFIQTTSHQQASHLPLHRLQGASQFTMTASLPPCNRRLLPGYHGMACLPCQLKIHFILHRLVSDTPSA